LGKPLGVKGCGRLGVICIAILLSACNGGTVDLHALENDSSSIDSLACEGALLAHEVVHGASPGPFTRVHAGELSMKASNFEDALSERPTTSGIERAVRKEAARAGRVADLLHRLEEADSGSAAQLEDRLSHEGGCP
jgi:hypothetical protein